MLLSVDKINSYLNIIGNIEGWEFIYQNSDASKI